MALNLSLQLVVGVLLEMVHKWWRVGPIYTLGVLSASVGYCLVDEFKLIGASGGVYCLIFACLPDIMVNWSESRAVFLPRWRDGRVAHACDGKMLRVLRLLAVIAFAVCDIIYTLVVGNEGVSVWAHGFGSAAGLMLGLVWLKDSMEEDWERWAKRLSAGLFIVLFVTGVGLNAAGYSDLV
jgi:rhomboid-related protein 1/2/3